MMVVVGARPNFMKAAPILAEMRRRSGFDVLLVHTGQHYDAAMSDVFFRDLGLPQPDFHLGVGSHGHAEQTARVMMALEPIALETKPDWMIVVGDVNSTVAAALVAAKLLIPVAHVEAGLRSFDRGMPEEVNRVVTDQISDLLFTTEESANQNLLREGIPEQRVHFVGNVMIDSLVRALPELQKSRIIVDLGLRERHYAVVTLHRPANVDDPQTLRLVLGALIDVARDLPVVFPVHPRTRARIRELPNWRDEGALRLIEPLGYVDFLRLTSSAAFVLTDSGGLQEETTYFGVPCLTMRPNTERPITLTHGTNRLVTPEGVGSAVRAAVQGGASASRNPPPFWDGRASERIVDILSKEPQGA